MELPSPEAASASPITAEEPIPDVALRPTRGWISLNLKELWAYRELLVMLALRDIKVRYKQAALGIAWFILAPLITAIIFAIIFGGLAHIPTDGRPYPIFAFSGILLFNLFSYCATNGVHSLTANQHLIAKVYFPRLIYPLAPIGSGLVNFCVGGCTLLGLMLYFRIAPSLTILLAPLFALQAAALGLAVGLWLGAMNVRYRDVGIAIPFIIQIWMFASPILYPLTLAKTQWRRGYPLFILNPISGIVEGFRWSVLGSGTGSMPVLAMIASPILILIALISGLFFFRRMEKFFSDLV